MNSILNTCLFEVYFTNCLTYNTDICICLKVERLMDGQTDGEHIPNIFRIFLCNLAKSNHLFQNRQEKLFRTPEEKRLSSKFLWRNFLCQCSVLRKRNVTILHMSLCSDLWPFTNIFILAEIRVYTKHNNCYFFSP